MRFTCRVHPKASRPRIEWDGALARVWVAEPAVDGRANRAVALALARWLDVTPSRVRLVAGTRSRTKIVEVDGLDSVDAGAQR